MRSDPIKKGINRAPARAMLKATGLTDADLDKPLIAVANTWSDVTPCNMHLRGLADKVKWLNGPKVMLARTVPLLSSAGYKIPQGGMYRWITSPNYFGEIVEWVGWAIMTWSLPGLAFALYTTANLAPRAISNHRWYRRTFPDYPRERRALVPFLL